ncbi:MAG TPA: hypothetical protein VH143_35295 [Kofleriaceae bacterium]|jgi:hypothetical protein|nr:hypothetical protein [Kofleriaceae bacterium]
MIEIVDDACMAKGIASALLVAALSIGGTAAADPAFEPSVDQTGIVMVPHHATGSWLDFGLLYGRVEPLPGTTISTEVVRFGPRAMINRFLYIGAEVDVGSLSEANDVSGTGTTARDSSSSGSSPEMGVPGYSPIGGGTYAAGKALVGAQLMAGPLSGALELAAGVRDYMTHDSVGQFGQAFFGGVYELHGRLDLWATRQITIGGLASVDLQDKSNVMFGVIAGFHFVPYDGHHH